MEEDKNLIIDEANREAEDYSCPSCGAPIKFSPEKEFYTVIIVVWK